jgi:prepilin-type N-terminal cleavage/methylation domain-containing protein
MIEDTHKRQSGFTLAEVMVVVVLAAVVGFGMVGFYLNSQATWIDASTQVMAQRDATLIVQTMGDRCRPWARAEVTSVSGPNDRLIVRDAGNVEKERFYWDPTDSLVHHTSNGAATGPGLVDTKVERFSLSVDASGRLVLLDSLRVISANGRRVRLSTAFALNNSSP